MRGSNITKIVLNGDCLRRFGMNQPVDNAPRHENYLLMEDYNTMKAVGHFYYGMNSIQWVYSLL